MKPIIVFILTLSCSLFCHAHITSPNNKITPIETPVQPPFKPSEKLLELSAKLEDTHMSSQKSHRFSWGDKMKESIADCVIGIILFLASFPTLWFNERRAVETDRMINDGQKHCVDVRADQVDEANEGKLVFVCGECKNNEVLTDSDLGISVPGALRLIRKVECYQWVEKRSQREERDIIGGGGTVYTDYSYQKEWTETYQDSNTFNSPTKQNPAVYEWPLRGEKFACDNACIGKFRVNRPQLEQLTVTQEYVVKDSISLQESLAKFQGNFKAGLAGQYILFRKLGSDDDIGNVRVSLQCVPSQVISIVAQQIGSGFQPFNIKQNPGFQPRKQQANSLPLDEENTGFLAGNREGDDKLDVSEGCCSCCFCCAVCSGMCGLCDSICHSPDEINWVHQGLITKNGLFIKKVKENALITQLIRFLGFAAMAGGIYLFFSPFYEVLQILPGLTYVGKFMGIVFALGVSIPLSMLIIIVAWVFYRPVLLILLMLVLGGIGAYIYFATKTVGGGAATSATVTSLF